MSSTRTQSDDYDDEVEYYQGRVVEEWRDPWNKADRPTGISGFGEKHGVHSWALPFRYYPDLNPYEAIRNIAEFLQGRRDSRRQVSRSAMNNESGASNFVVPGLEEIALIHGWWPGGSRTTAGDYYCNPNYPHEFREDEILAPDNFPTVDEETVELRKDLARRAASLGISSELLARPFGVADTDSVTKWCRDNDIQYGELRREGLKTMARTYKTMNHWGLTKRDIAETFGLPGPTLYTRLELVEDFDPPDEPSIPEFADGGEE